MAQRVSLDVAAVVATLAFGCGASSTPNVADPMIVGGDDGGSGGGTGASGGPASGSGGANRNSGTAGDGRGAAGFAGIGGANDSGSSGGGGSGGSDVHSGADAGETPQHQVRACGSDAGLGHGGWENVTPPGLSLEPGFKTPAGDNYGAVAFVVNPQDTATVYLGTSAQGIFKTTDCGATWKHVSNGLVDKGRNGTMVIDPVDPNVLYTDGRYGPPGLFKSTNGGVDWTQILPPEIANVFIYGGVVEWVAIDPNDHLHLTVTPHFNCTGTHAPYCMLETVDAGATWRVIDNAPESDELGGQVMLDRTTWLSAQPFSGIWRTADGGVSWTHVYKGQAFPYLYRGADGTYYMPGGNPGVLRSSDGIAWSAIAKSNGSGALAFTKTALYSSLGLNGSAYDSASVDTPTQWVAIPSVPATAGNGGWMIGGDVDHDLIYSSNFKGGFWRYSKQ